MKIKLYLFILTLLFLLGGCILKDQKEGMEIKNLTLSSEERGVTFDVNIDFDVLKINEEDVISYGVLIMEGKISNINDITFDFKDEYLESTNIEDNVVSFSISDIAEERYEYSYSIRAYIKYYDSLDQENFIYGDSFQVFCLYDLAKTSNEEFALEVINAVEKEKVVEVDVEIDYNTNEIKTSLECINAHLEEDGENLILNINPKEGYYFASTTTFYINKKEIDKFEYTLLSDNIEYIFKKPNLDDDVDVLVTFDPNGGFWDKNILSKLEPNAVLTATTLNDISGQTYTILDNSQIAYRDFYKLFLKFDETIKAYKIVAFDSGTSHIINLDLPAYDYVLAVHDDCVDTNAVKTIKRLLQEQPIGMYVLLDGEVNANNNITTTFYNENSIFENYTTRLLEKVNLPIPNRQQYRFLGWSDGEKIYDVFPGYKVSDNLYYITYTAIWEPYSMEDFIESMNLILPEKLDTSINLPTTFGNYQVSWSSSHPQILSNSGEYKKPYQSQTITLTATLTSNGIVENINFELMASGYKELKLGIASSYIYRNYSLVDEEFFDTLDIINCAFITADENGYLSGSNFLKNVSNYIIPKAHEKGDWVVMSIAPSSKWSSIASSSEKIEVFANNIVKMINEYGFDGVDIDWETPSSSEKENFTAMMATIYEKVKANNSYHIVSAAIAGGKWQPSRYDLDNSQVYIDYINMMTYSMTNNSGYYQNALYPSASFHNQSFGVGKTLVSCSISESIAIFRDQYNIPYHKIIVGIPFYGVKQENNGQGWTSRGSVLYTSLVSSYLNNSDYSVYYDEECQVPYILKNDGTIFISYDNERSISAKCDYVLKNSLGGIMYWENGCDTTGTLLNALKMGLDK